MLFNVTMQTFLDGNTTGKGFSSTFLMRSTVEPGSEQMLTWLRGLDVIYQPIMVDRFMIYSFTATPIEVPGRRKKNRDDHCTHYAEKYGLVELPLEKDPALLTVSAQFIKYVTRGTSGSMEIRGVLTEDELKSNVAGLPVNQNKAREDVVNARFADFALALNAHVKTLPGGTMVMPGKKVSATGAVNSLVEYENTARPVGKISFEGFVQRDTTKTQRDNDAKILEVARSLYNELKSYYNDALASADGVAAGITPDTLEELRDRGRKVYKYSDQSIRQKLRLQAPYAQFVKEI